MNQESGLSDIERDVIALASIASPISVDLIRSVLGLDDNDVTEAVDRLVERGALEFGRRGVTAAVEGEPSARRSMLAARLLSALDERGADAELTAAAAWAAGESSRAYADYREVISRGGAPLEVLDRAIESGTDAGAPRDQIAGLLVDRARSHRNRGESDAAMADLDAALRDLDGADLVDALAFAGAVADDRQHPADAERHVAMAMLVAADLELLDKLGSLQTLHGRVLARIGFSREADDSFERGLALVQAHGSDVQEYYASLNQAWTAFDRGWMARAEQGYAARRP